MSTGTRANKKLGDRLIELTGEAAAAANTAAYSCRPDPYLRSAIKSARANLARADKSLGLAFEATKKSGEA